MGEGVYSDVFFLLIPLGKYLNRHSDEHIALKDFKYFETANGFYLQNTLLRVEEYSFHHADRKPRTVTLRF